MEFDLSQTATKNRLIEFAEKIIELQKKIDIKLSARGWGYQLESARLINKNEFNKVEKWINACRRKGVLPIDFIAEEGRQFKGVEKPDKEPPVQFMGKYIRATLEAEEYYTPNWWEGETYYIQMLVEKIDLRNLFIPICQKYHIPIATSGGWSSMLQRAIFSNRFKEAEENGLKTILLYCGDHDPDGIRISNTIRKNLKDLSKILWSNETTGYDPQNLTIDRFGLNYDFIEENKLTWIDNLITGGTKNKKKLDLSDPAHKNHNMPYVQDYLKKFGARKCEANAIIPIRDKAKELVENNIIKYLGLDAENRFEAKRESVKEQLNDFREKTGLNDSLNTALDMIKENEGDELNDY